ncbi:hypothetical protein [Streptomyces osmaniensis]|uniref:Uncharacterized protein n=1 Tax=Streptomyces osmaniensis TaxID=593134 RepID=A0ABP6YYI8_9ACTN|nr:hypothetical protein KJK32_46780 [Streptomyces sp. JCM17656]
MSITSIETTTPGNADKSYNSGFLDGELDAISKLPARTAMDRARMADAYDPMWAQGYADGFLSQIQATHALTTNGPVA